MTNDTSTSADEQLALLAMQEPEGPPSDIPASPKSGAESEERLPEFDVKHRQAFHGLLYVGHLTQEFTIYGHSFRIMTPTEAERLEIGVILKPFQGTISQDIAYATAIVAAYLVEVDGNPLPQPIENNPKDAAIWDRWRWVTENLKREVARQIYERCLEMDATVGDVLEAMGKASG